VALPRVVSEIFNVEKYCDYEILVTGQSRSLKVVPFDRLGIVFLLVFYSNFVIRRTVLGDNRLQLCRDLENQPRRRRRRRVAGQASD